MDDADFVLIGADSILADGSIINKIGTSVIALTAWEKQVPFYVVCEKIKFNVWNWLLGKKAVVLEEKDPSEIFDPKNLSRIMIRNIYFDITPAKYVWGIITEDGVIKPSEVSSHIEKFFRKLYLL
jgi:translation initiation factor 2B subunit (eIF-2B alpha/beta/delta family)